MSKPVLLKWVNVLMLAAFLLQTGTGVALAANMAMDVGDFHAVNGFVFAALALVHLALNWGWVKANFLKRRA